MPRRAIVQRKAEAALLEWWLKHAPRDLIKDLGEWYVEIGGVRYSIGQQAEAVAEAIEGRGP